MPLFGRVHEYKEYEHESEKKVWKVSGMKWTLPKKRKDPQRYISRTQTHSGQQMNKRALILKEGWLSPQVTRKIDVKDE